MKRTTDQEESLDTKKLKVSTSGVSIPSDPGKDVEKPEVQKIVENEEEKESRGENLPGPSIQHEPAQNFILVNPSNVKIHTGRYLLRIKASVSTCLIMNFLH